MFLYCLVQQMLRYIYDVLPYFAMHLVRIVRQFRQT